MDEDRPDRIIRASRLRTRRARPKYTNDLPPETVEALMNYDDIDNESLTHKTCEASPDAASENNNLPSSIPCDTKPRSTSITANIRTNISTQHRYMEMLTEERRKLWGQMEEHEARIREHQTHIVNGDEGDDLINKRFQVCEMLEEKISQICNRLWNIGGDLDESAVKVRQLLGDLVENGPTN
ncbi:hypothetical protein FLONG3_1611 [Fusarium longipes]|uniref:Uncharacterized protein n=1 Tax=Fusarium longipes TaxID=694270 RepID=A0A395T6H4_9HYPO|nr:hypothetical protein FLONG3_1611 [Fusarium longipes]